MINPFLYTERHLPVAVERADLLPKRLLPWRRQAAADATAAPVTSGAPATRSAPPPRPRPLRRILR